MSRFERDNIRRMQGYTSGEQPQDEATIKLNTNENPYPPSPQVDKLIATFTANDLRRYPPATAASFRQAAARLHGLAPEQVIATRGGDELLRLVITTFVAPGEKVGTTDPSYSLYPVLAQVQDCPLVSVPLAEDWSNPPELAEVMNREGVKLTLAVNPHAPSGRLTSVAALDQLAGQLDSLLMIDEAYIDFVEGAHPSVELVKKHDNVIILRSLSKGYSLAGLRFGYGLAPASLITPMMDKTRDSYNLDLFGQLLAEAALSDQAYAKSTWQKVMAERARLQQALAGLGIACPNSAGNFLLASIPDGQAQPLYEYLKKSHILVRHFPAPRLADKLRITVGTPEEDDRLLDAIRAFFNG